MFWGDFFIKSLLFTNIYLPIKSILNTPFFCNLLKSANTKQIETFFTIVKLINIHGSDDSLDTIISELKERKNRRYVSNEDIENMFSIISPILKDNSIQMQFETINRAVFHKQYLMNLRYFIKYINSQGFYWNSSINIPKFSLKYVLQALDQIDPDKWTDKSYFGAGEAERIMETHGGKLGKLLKISVHPIWIYTYQQIKPKYILLTREERPFFFLYDSIYADTKESTALRPITASNQILSNRIEQEAFSSLIDWHLLTQMQVPVPRIPKSIDLDSIIELRESPPIKAYRKLLYSIRNAIEANIINSFSFNIQKHYAEIGSIFDDYNYFLEKVIAEINRYSDIIKSDDMKRIISEIPNRKYKLKPALEKLTDIGAAFSIAKIFISLAFNMGINPFDILFSFPKFSLLAYRIIDNYKESKKPIGLFLNGIHNPYYFYNPITGEYGID